MFLSALVTAVLFPALARAQGYGGGGSTPQTTTSTSAATIPTAPPSTANQVNIDVTFNGNFVFNPANVTASNGSFVTFYFPNSPLTHSVTQSSFAQPCTPLAANSTANTPAGFDSGLTKAVQFTIQIVDATKPIWFHCKQVTHCGQGMVGSINAPATGNTFDQFMANAKAIGANEQTEQDNGFVSGGVNAIATAAPTNTAAPSGGNPPSSASKLVSHLAVAFLGAIAVIVAL